MIESEEFQFFMDNLINFITPPDGFCEKKAFIALGVFDGVHPGHQAVIQKAAARARELGIAAGAVTFVPHPKQILTPENPPQLLVSPEKRTALLLEAGADFVASINFTPEVAAWEPEFFLERLFDNPAFQIVGISVGATWKFGRRGAGDRQLLSSFARKKNVSFSPVEELRRNGVTVSSTLIRQLLARGEIRQAADIWQQPVTLEGVVVTGIHAASTELAAPTANIIPDSGLLIPDGVYAGVAGLPEGDFPAVINVGSAPTYKISRRRIEVHLIGFSGDIYGKILKTELSARLRDIRKFDSPAQLREQIKEDIANALLIAK